MQIGHYQIEPHVVLAPMAGITDRPFRILCRRMGAGMATSEMVASNPLLRKSKKTLLRLNHEGESAPRAVQLVGTEPQVMADAAKFNVDNGAEIIDINMGCPAKKVCNVMAGSALLQDEQRVQEILEAVVNAVDIPVTLKIRTGVSPENKNAVKIAQIAEQSGVRSLVVHGRTRACAYRGQAEYKTIREVKQAVSIPVIANGDITTPEIAKKVLDETHADALMIGRAALGNPWIFREIDQFLSIGTHRQPPTVFEIKQVMLEHLTGLYEFYGEHQGVRIARKHIGWYLQNLPAGKTLWQQINRVEKVDDQLTLLDQFFENIDAKKAAA